MLGQSRSSVPFLGAFDVSKPHKLLFSVWGERVNRPGFPVQKDKRLHRQGYGTSFAFLGVAIIPTGTGNLGAGAMYHTIEFRTELAADLEVSPKLPLERLAVRKGTRTKVWIKPYVIETEHGLFEMADLTFADGTTTRMVPFESFMFVE
jgi:hypothetical protein